MTKEELDKAIENAMGIWPTSIPKAWIEEIMKLPIIGNDLAKKLFDLNEQLGEFNPLKTEAEKAIKDIAYTLLSKAEELNKFLEENGLNSKIFPEYNVSLNQNH